MAVFDGNAIQEINRNSIEIEFDCFLQWIKDNEIDLCAIINNELFKSPEQRRNLLKKYALTVQSKTDLYRVMFFCFLLVNDLSMATEISKVEMSGENSIRDCLKDEYAQD